MTVLPIARANMALKDMLTATFRRKKRVVSPSELFISKSREAISSVLNLRSRLSLSKLKSRAVKLCDRLNLSQLVNTIGKNKNKF